MISGNLYSLLGIPPSASADDIKLAYRGAARRFHPDINKDLAASEEFKYITEAHGILSEPEQRARYDESLKQQGAPSLLVIRSMLSRQRVPALNEPQVVYALVDIRPGLASQNLPAPPVNLSLVIDRSTSMQGERLDQVKVAVSQLIDGLRENDSVSVTTFSDRADVILSAQQGTPEHRNLAKARVSTIYAAGGTEILQGLQRGLMELFPIIKPSAVNHLMLLTDGRTYGDEGHCMLLAALANADGVSISGLGIGDEWNDKFLDELTTATGGGTAFVNSPEKVSEYMREKVRGLSAAYGERLKLRVILDHDVKLLEVFKVSPEPMPITLEETLRLGVLPREQTVTVLLKLLLPPFPEGARPIARLALYGDLLALGRRSERATHDLAVNVQAKPEYAPPPPAMVEALNKLSHHHLQERAFQQAANGDNKSATRTLSVLGTRLLASGQPELARMAITEARRLEGNNAVSEDAKKRIKYGTRALVMPVQGSE